MRVTYIPRVFHSSVGNVQHARLFFGTVTSQLLTIITIIRKKKKKKQVISIFFIEISILAGKLCKTDFVRRNLSNRANKVSLPQNIFARTELH